MYHPSYCRTHTAAWAWSYPPLLTKLRFGHGTLRCLRHALAELLAREIASARSTVALKQGLRRPLFCVCVVVVCAGTRCLQRRGSMVEGAGLCCTCSWFLQRGAAPSRVRFAWRARLHTLGNCYEYIIAQASTPIFEFMSCLVMLFNESFS